MIYDYVKIISYYNKNINKINKDNINDLIDTITIIKKYFKSVDDSINYKKYRRILNNYHKLKEELNNDNNNNNNNNNNNKLSDEEINNIIIRLKEIKANLPKLNDITNDNIYNLVDNSYLEIKKLINKLLINYASLEDELNFKKYQNILLYYKNKHNGFLKYSNDDYIKQNDQIINNKPANNNNYNTNSTNANNTNSINNNSTYNNSTNNNYNTNSNNNSTNNNSTNNNSTYNNSIIKKNISNNKTISETISESFDNIVSYPFNFLNKF